MIHEKEWGLWRLFDAAVRSGDNAEAAKVARRGAHLQRKRGDLRHAGIWQRAVANALFQQGLYDDALRECLKSVATLEDDYEKALSLVWAGAISSFKDDFKQAADFFDRAAQLGERYNGDSYLWTHFFGTRALALKRQGLLDRAIVDYEGAIEIVQREGWLWRAAAYTNNLAFLMIDLGRVTEAERRLKHALTLILRDRHPTTEASIYDSLGTLYTLKQDYSKALRFLQKAASAFKRQHNTAELTRTLIKLSDLYAHMGEWLSARSHAQEALRVALKMKDAKLVAQATQQIGAVALSSARSEQVTS